jgi:hypothetical protein
MTAFAPRDDVAAIRDRLDHPVIDSDGHQIELMPLVRDFAVELGGEAAGRALDQLVASGRGILDVPPGDERRRRGLSRTGWWSLPTRNTLDRATCMLPALLRARLDEIGIDYAVLYPTYGFFAGIPAEAELRRCSRARSTAIQPRSSRERATGSSPSPSSPPVVPTRLSTRSATPPASSGSRR